MELYGSLVANEGSGGGGGGTVDVPIKSISVNGSGVAPINKNVNIDVPTKTSELENDSNFASTADIPTKVSELENDSNFASTSDIPTKTSQLTNDSSFVTESDLTSKNYADKTYVGEQIAQSEHLKREIVTVLPEHTVADEHTIYMVKDDSVTGNDKYKEYMLIEGLVQCIGDTSVDLTDYAKTYELPTELPANGGNADTVNNHTVESNVPVDAKFTDTVYDDTEVKVSIAEVNSNLGVIGKCKNLFNPTLQTTTQSGVTCTNNGDETYTLNGTPTQQAYFKIGTVKLTKGKTYKIVASVVNNKDTFAMFIQDTSGTQTVWETDNDGIFTAEYEDYNINIRCYSGNANNILFKPMITTDINATYDDFVPYTGDGETLASDVAEIKKDLGDLTFSVSGATLTITDGTNTWTLEANN